MGIKTKHSAIAWFEKGYLIRDPFLRIHSNAQALLFISKRIKAINLLVNPRSFTLVASLEI